MLFSRWLYIFSGFVISLIFSSFILGYYYEVIFYLIAEGLLITLAFKADKREYLNKKIPDFFTKKEKKEISEKRINIVFPS